MYGKNEVASPFPYDDGRLLVAEIFPTLQGEGPDAGLPAVFVRLAKCNLRCFWCDTMFDSGQWWASGPLVEQVQAMMPKRANLVVLTGGEPFLQNVVPFIRQLNQQDIRVSVETAGTVCPQDVWKMFDPSSRNMIVCSPKTPKVNTDLLPYITVFKYVVSNTDLETSEDGLPVMSTQKPGVRLSVFRPPPGDRRPIYVQPLDTGEPALNTANLVAASQIALKHGYRFGVQLHKLADLP